VSADVKLILCSLVRGGDPHVESTIARCSRCLRQVWLARSSEPVISKFPGASLVCRHCAPLAARELGVRAVATTERQENETKRLTGHTTTEILEDIFGITPQKVKL
jgi:hypothetical protein